MESLYHFIAPPSRCGYLPNRDWRMEYEVVGKVTPAEYQRRLREGWRRFGYTLFRPRCRGCMACQSLRVVVDQFRPNRSQQRCARANEGAVTLSIGRPAVTDEKLALYDRYHAFQADFKGWPEHGPKDAAQYRESFVENPFPVQEWCYYLGGRLIGVGYVDDLPEGLSAIYFYYDPAERDRSPGVWNVLSIIAEAARRRLPHVYLGYYVEGCRSLEYKANYAPNQILRPDGAWRDFRA
jgi:arginine-tRNA-protein transferase